MDGEWYFYPAPIYPYPDPYVPPGAAVAAPPAPTPLQYWYYCPSAQAYYPYVSACPEGWTPVVPPASARAPRHAARAEETSLRDGLRPGASPARRVGPASSSRWSPRSTGSTAHTGNSSSTRSAPVTRRQPRPVAFKGVVTPEGAGRIHFVGVSKVYPGGMVALQGVDLHEAARCFRLHPDRIGDLVVLGDRDTVFGPLDRPVEDLPADFRTHGSTHELRVPLVVYGVPVTSRDRGAHTHNVHLTRSLNLGD